MVTSRVGPRGLEAGDLPDQPCPAWKAVWATYTTVFIPLSNSLYSSKALGFFLWLKQMKELEQEKDTLLAGLEVVDQAREWYQDQIQIVTERQRRMGQSNPCMEFLSETGHSRLNILLPKLQEVNHCLSGLLSCTGMPITSPAGLPLSIPTNAQPHSPTPPQAVMRLKDQNSLLTQEVTEKSERIAQLEQEKSALVQQLFDMHICTQDDITLDSTFI
ncbi:hypothetical protein SKAU_G00006180 [Synaphobranchus kaupii]|uniref:Suppressor APC domain containing 2 n=1 Tax=Synaphobranchus kaupii TaxID=118154 RepID=A0A9Q1GA66_SYNKA|nr:hypothetical protein SKAU_G00006180 [Synaphobranchus kaupii]